MMDHQINADCLYADEGCDKTIWADQNEAQDVEAICGWSRLMRFARAVRLQERRRHKQKMDLIQ